MCDVAVCSGPDGFFIVHIQRGDPVSYCIMDIYVMGCCIIKRGDCCWGAGRARARLIASV